MTELRTSETLLRALRDATARKLSTDELRQQRVSFIMGTLKPTSDVTRARVEDVLDEMEGAKRN